MVIDLETGEKRCQETNNGIVEHVAQKPGGDIGKEKVSQTEPFKSRKD